MSSINFACRRRFWAILVVGVVGCARSDPADERSPAANPAAMVPVSGVVTVNGKPMAMVVVTFLPANGPGVGNGETDQEGKYQLSSVGGNGLYPDFYKVAISYLVSDQGEPQGLRARSSQVQPEGMRTAKEQVPAEYSDLGRTTLSAKVGARGGTFDFDVPAPLLGTVSKPTETKDEKAKPIETKNAGKKE